MGSTTGIIVTSEELQNLSSQVKNTGGSLLNELNGLEGNVQSVVGNGDWSGAASSQFQALFAEWKSSATSLQNTLETISSLLANAATQYQNTEDAVRSSFNQQ